MIPADWIGYGLFALVVVLSAWLVYVIVDAARYDEWALPRLKKERGKWLLR